MKFPEYTQEIEYKGVTISATFAERGEDAPLFLRAEHEGDDVSTWFAESEQDEMAETALKEMEQRAHDSAVEDAMERRRECLTMEE